MKSHQEFRLRVAAALFAAGCLLRGAALAEDAVKDATPATASLIHPGEPWLDTDGQPIQAHSAGMLFHNGVYFWFGENKSASNNLADAQGRVPVIGVSAYSSRDLVHWKNEGLVLKAMPDDPGHDLHLILCHLDLLADKPESRYVLGKTIDYLVTGPASALLTRGVTADLECLLR